jgi:hypothetical protein
MFIKILKYYIFFIIHINSVLLRKFPRIFRVIPAAPHTLETTVMRGHTAYYGFPDG